MRPMPLKGKMSFPLALCAVLIGNIPTIAGMLEKSAIRSMGHEALPATSIPEALSESLGNEASSPDQPSLASTASLPLGVKEWLMDKDREDLVRRFETIPALSPREFIEEMKRSGPLTLVGAGTEGVVFKDKNGYVWKISLAIPEALGLVTIREENNKLSPDELQRVREEWASIEGISVFVESLRELLPQRVTQGWPMKNRSLTHEMIGGLVAQSYSDREINLPGLMSRDGFGYRSKWIEGSTLHEEIEKDEPAMNRIWEELTYWQRINEKMLMDSGLAFDILSPSNLVVQRNNNDIRLHPVDNSLARPSQEVIDWYRGHGIAIPTPSFLDDVSPFEGPVMSLQIVSHRLWGLRYEQAVEYVKVYFGLSDRTEAVRRLAEVKKWTNQRYPRIVDHSHIDRARRESGIQEENPNYGAQLGMK